MKDKITLQATAVGSLPCDSPEKALSLIFSCFEDFPVWPQLAKVNPNEDMIAQYTEAIPGTVFDKADNRWYIDPEAEDFYEKLEEFYLDYEEIVTNKDFDLLEKYAISKEFSSVLPLFLEKLKTYSPSAIKGQITGPFTYGTSLVDRENRCAFYDETLKEIIIKGLTLKALWQIKKFKEASPNSIPVIFMDEPTISQYGTSTFITIKKDELVSALSEIISVLQDNGAIVGIHCCGKSDWSIVTESGANILNFDAFSFAESLGIYAKEIGNFLQKGGKIAWGLVPTLDDEALAASTTETMLEKYETAINYLIAKGVDKDLIIDSSFITPTCGMGSLSVELAEKAAKLTSETGKKLRSQYL